MMENEYNLDFLIQSFSDHYKKWEPTVVHHEDGTETMYDFSLALALLTICKEIKKLKDKNEKV